MVRPENFHACPIPIRPIRSLHQRNHSFCLNHRVRLSQNMAPSPDLLTGETVPDKKTLASNEVAVSLSKSPAGKSPSLWEQALRLVLLVTWLLMTCIGIVTTQFIGVPLAFWDKNLFYAYSQSLSY
jgi:hypothetical protein